MRFLGFILLFALHLPLQAQLSCASLFRETPRPTASKKPAKNKTPLSEELLAQEGFRLSETEDLLGEKYLELRDIRNENIIIGKVSKSAIPFLYQWGEGRFQEMNLQHGEIKNAVMIRVIEKAPQTYGKGYYASKDPYDASMYGTDLTVFKTKSDIVHIEQSTDGESINLVEAPTDLIYRLRRAGIEATHSWKVKTWFSFIDHRNLKVAKAASLKDAPEWQPTETNLLNQFLIFNKLSRTGIERWLPADHLLVKAIQKNLSAKEVTQLKLILAQMKEYECENTYGTGIGQEDQAASIILIKNLLKAY